MRGWKRTGLMSLAAALLALALLGTIRMRSLLAFGHRATGTIVEGPNAEGMPSLYLIEYRTQQNSVVRFRQSAIGYQGWPGSPVAIVYDPRDPMTARIRSFYSLWGEPVALALLGLLCAWLGLRRRAAN